MTGGVDMIVWGLRQVPAEIPFGQLTKETKPNALPGHSHSHLKVMRIPDI